MSVRKRSCIAQIWEDDSLTMMARVLAHDGEPAVVADYTSITYAVHDADGNQIIAPTGLTPADVAFDTLQTDARWGQDETGYNFRFTLGPTAFPDGGKTYFVEVLVTPNGGTAFVLHVWEVPTLHLRRS